MSEETFTVPTSGIEIRIGNVTPEQLARIKAALTPPTFAIPSEITEQIIALTDYRRAQRGAKALKHAFMDREVRIEALIPGYALVWHADIQAYGLFPESRCDGGRGSRFDDSATYRGARLHKLKGLLVQALTVEGRLRKQGYLWKIAELLGIDLADQWSDDFPEPERGIAP